MPNNLIKTDVNHVILYISNVFNFIYQFSNFYLIKKYFPTVKIKNEWMKKNWLQPRLIKNDFIFNSGLLHTIYYSLQLVLCAKYYERPIIVSFYSLWLKRCLNWIGPVCTSYFLSFTIIGNWLQQSIKIRLKNPTKLDF